MKLARMLYNVTERGDHLALAKRANVYPAFVCKHRPSGMNVAASGGFIHKPTCMGDCDIKQPNV